MYKKKEISETLRVLASGGELLETRGLSVMTSIPDNEQLDDLLQLIRHTLFPTIYDVQRFREDAVTYYRVQAEKMMAALTRQIAICLSVGGENRTDSVQHSLSLAQQFIDRLPSVRTLLLSDVEAVVRNDPAVASPVEVVCCYPAITVMLHYRVAHILHELGVPFLPRMMTERAHSATGVDIHPAAQIGASFGIDHGTGIVIGATAIIGSHVMIYQGVTLGAKNFQHDADARPIDLPRHPIIEDRVTIYSNTSVLGRIRIGHDSVIGGNLWITKDVKPYSQLRQTKPIEQVTFSNGLGI